MRNLIIVCAVLAGTAIVAAVGVESLVENKSITVRRDVAPSTAPADRGEARPQPDSTSRAQKNQPGALERKARPSGSVTIDAAADGHFYLDMRINGEIVRAVVDTGASLVALRESDARKAGLWIRRSDFTLPLATANGRAFGAPVMLRTVRHRSIAVRDVEAVVIPDAQLSVSLLGNTFLGRLSGFEVRGDRLVFEN